MPNACPSRVAVHVASATAGREVALVELPDDVGGWVPFGSSRMRFDPRAGRFTGAGAPVQTALPDPVADYLAAAPGSTRSDAVTFFGGDQASVRGLVLTDGTVIPPTVPAAAAVTGHISGSGCVAAPPARVSCTINGVPVVPGAPLPGLSAGGAATGPSGSGSW